MKSSSLARALRTLPLAALCGSLMGATPRAPDFRVIAFFTGKEDQAHISFLHEAEQWFPGWVSTSRRLR